ncbi:MAG: superoxide dismutase family protein [Chitinivibrionales bacterium]|nr:superoxide dismutase family protein [Chitinivibrionales bacterium]
MPQTSVHLIHKGGRMNGKMRTGVQAAMAIAMLLSCAGAGNAPQRARAVLLNAEADTVGTVTFEEQDTGVLIVADIDGLPPGEHAFHIHEKALCEAPDFTSAGGHFNPFGTQHGFLNDKGPHAGDLPNITVGEDSTVRVEQRTRLITLESGAENSLFREGGTSVVIHQDPDDYITDPAGTGGARIACGAIERVESDGRARPTQRRD